MLGLLGVPTHSVARTLDNRYINDFLERFRGATGQHIVPKNGGYDQILEVLGGKGTMAFLADQAAGPKGCWVDFFGRPASTYKAIALLALEHDAPIAVCYARRLDRPMHFEMVVSDMIDPRDTDGQVATVKDLTQWYTHKLEEAIRENPEQYWWVHRRWKDNRRKKKQAGREEGCGLTGKSKQAASKSARNAGLGQCQGLTHVMACTWMERTTNTMSLEGEVDGNSNGSRRFQVDAEWRAHILNAIVFNPLS